MLKAASLSRLEQKKRPPKKEDVCPESSAQKTGAPIVVGLDPMMKFVPEHIQQAAQKEFGATLEGAAEAIWQYNKGIVDATAESGVPMDTLYAIGGGSKNLLWLKIKASLLRQMITIQENAVTALCSYALWV